MKFTEVLEEMLKDNSIKAKRDGYDLVVKFNYDGELAFVDTKDEKCENQYMLRSDLTGNWTLIKPPKPKYKLWEVIKMLDENHDRKFFRKTKNEIFNISMYYPQFQGMFSDGFTIGLSDYISEWEEE